MTDHRFVCTRCDSFVALATDYDGYHGKCDCQSYYLRIGNRDKPIYWSKLDDVTDPSHFKVYHDGYIKNDSVVSEPHVNCTKCGSGEAVSVCVEDVSMGLFDLKAVFTCRNKHYHNDRELESVAYYTQTDRTGTVLRELASEGVST